MRREKDVKDAVKKILDQAGAWYFMPVCTGYGRYGIPDFIICHRRRFIAIETKFSTRSLTAHQMRELEKIKAAKGIALVVNETNFNLVEEVLDGVPYENYLQGDALNEEEETKKTSNMRCERDVKDAVKSILAGAWCYYFMPVCTGYGRYGIPDFIICHRGQFIAIETKFSTRPLTKYQERELQNIQAAGGIALVINQTNLNRVKEVLSCPGEF
jgi:hypothetical protein